VLGGVLAQYADRGAVLGDHLNATDGEPSGSGAAHGAGHVTLLEGCDHDGLLSGVKGPFDAFWFFSGIILRVFMQKAITL
jgi:hypothetical protein